MNRSGVFNDFPNFMRRRFLLSHRFDPTDRVWSRRVLPKLRHVQTNLMPRRKLLPARLQQLATNSLSSRILLSARRDCTHPLSNRFLLWKLLAGGHTVSDGVSVPDARARRSDGVRRRLTLSVRHDHAVGLSGRFLLSKQFYKRGDHLSRVCLSLPITVAMFFLLTYFD
jgi:hypothetical protein